MKLFILLIGLILASYSSRADHIQLDSPQLTLEAAIETSQKNDLWLKGNKHAQDAIDSMGTASGALPDPKISVGVANIAADSFDFSQEPMTQLKLGISQTLPRGDTLPLTKQRFAILSSRFPFERADRNAKIKLEVSKLWLNAYEAQESIALIEKDKALFEQLADVAQANYSSAIGATRQHDIVRAQLELTRLDDRLAMLKQQFETSKQKLGEYLNNYFDHSISSSFSQNLMRSSDFNIDRNRPSIKMSNPSLYMANRITNPQTLIQQFSKHPAVLAVNKTIEASENDINLAKQKYKPEWGISASYGYREPSALASGIDRSDLFSIGVSFDLPIFTSSKQDQEVQSAISKTSAIKTRKWLLVRQLISSFETNRSQLIRLSERQTLYRDRLLPQIRDQAEASLTAYTNDDGDFSEVVRSRIAELNASIDFLSIDVERQKSIAQLNYYFTAISNSNHLDDKRMEISSKSPGARQ